MTEELVKEKMNIDDIDINDIENIISKKIDAMEKLKDKVKAATKAANEANKYINSKKEYRDKGMSSYEEKGKWIFKRRVGDTKDIIGDTQEAVRRLSEAQQSHSIALDTSLKFQKQVTDTMRFLFYIGCLSIAANRTVVRQLKLKMSGASKAQISEFENNELLNLLKQLKEQEDMMMKQEFLTSKLKENVLRLNKKDEQDEKQEKDISLNKDHIEKIENNLKEKSLLDNEQSEQISILKEEMLKKDSIDSLQEQAIAKNKDIIRSIEDDFREKSSLDIKQSEQISVIEKTISAKDKIDAEQYDMLESLEKMLYNKDLVDYEQEELIGKNSKSIMLLFDYMKKKNYTDEVLQTDIELLQKLSRSKLRFLPITISSLALLLAIISFIITFNN